MKTSEEIEYRYVKGHGWVAGYKEDARTFTISFDRATIQEWYAMRISYAQEIRHVTITGTVIV